MRVRYAILPACYFVCGFVAAAPTEPPASAPAPVAEQLISQNLTLLTGNNTLEARRIGARGLLLVNDEAGLNSIKQVLQSGDEPLAHLAICQELAVTDHPPASLIESVMGLLDSPRDDVCAAAAAAIARFPRAVVVPRLANQAASSAPSESDARRAAVTALSRLGDTPDAVAALIRALDHADADLSEAVLEAVERATGVYVATPDDARRWWTANKEKDIRAWLLERSNRREAMFRAQESRVNELARRLVELSRADYLRRDESEKSPRLLALLADNEPTMRQLGLELTNGLITDRRPVPPDVAQRVRGLLTDSLPDLRRAAAGIIGDLRDIKDSTVLIEALQHETVARVRAALLRSLGRVGDASVLPTLQDALKDPNPDVVYEAVSAIGFVCEKANGGAGEAKSAAAAAILSRFDHVGTGEITLLAAFIDTMGRLSDRRFDPLLTRYLQSGYSPEVRQAALRAAAARNDSVLADQIAASLADESTAVRLSAAGALGRCGKTDAHLSALLQRFDGAGETDGGVKIAAWEAFQRIWQTRALQDRLRWADRIAPPLDAVSATRRAALFNSLERELAQSDPTSAHRRLAAERLADALLVLNQPEQALILYQTVQNGKREDPPIALSEKLIRAAVRADKPDLAAAVVVRCAATQTAIPDGSATIITVVADEGRRLLKQYRRDAAEALAQQIESALVNPMPDAWSAEWQRFRNDLAAGPTTQPATASAPTNGI